MITGINVVDAGVGLEGIVLTAEQYGVPPANAMIGGTHPMSIIPMMPVGLLVAGIICVTVTEPTPDGTKALTLPIEISVLPTAPFATEISSVDLRHAYEQLRQQMASEGVPFLNAVELEREITEYKGTRS